MNVIRTRSLIVFGLVVILLFIVSGIATAALIPVSGMAAAAPMSGAIWTTDTSGTVNRNIYAAKTDVYLNGGPANNNAPGLPDGNYWVKVTAPNGTLLGYSNTAIAVVIDGRFVQSYQLWQILVKASNGTIGYDDTPNGGGVYKVWASQNSSFPSNESKTDNFKVKREAENVQGSLEIYKFYDKNANGIWDIDEVQLPYWKVNVSDQFNYFEDGYTPMTTILFPGVYWVKEYMPLEPNWVPTTLSYVTTTVYNGGITYVIFGNVCLGSGGAHTLGYWANKGRVRIDTDDLAMLRALNLVSGSGSAFDPYSREEVRSWLLGANATNMANMLSAQLAAMALSVYNGDVNGNSMVYAPGLLPFAPIPGLNQFGFISINNLMTAANTELGAHPVAYSSSQWRLYQERLKNALDSANNNLNFVMSTPCPYTFN